MKKYKKMMEKYNYKLCWESGKSECPLKETRDKEKLDKACQIWQEFVFLVSDRLAGKWLRLWGYHPDQECTAKEKKDWKSGGQMSKNKLYYDKRYIYDTGKLSLSCKV